MAAWCEIPIRFLRTSGLDYPLHFGIWALCTALEGGEPSVEQFSGAAEGTSRREQIRQVLPARFASEASDLDEDFLVQV
jgi:hypothetical protein